MPSVDKGVDMKCNEAERKNCRHSNDIVTVFSDGKVRYLCPKCGRAFILTHFKPLPSGVKPRVGLVFPREEL